MDIYEVLSLKTAAGKEEPDVWVSRLVIYKNLLPEPVLIREVKLSRGLNIVWAEEPDNDDATAEIAGHSAGKTSFCRLLRYVLGEKTFATKANAKLIQMAFPKGYVAAELHVCGKKWAVIRPFDKTRRSYTKTDSTIEDLLTDKTGPAGQDDYIERLGLKAFLEPLETATVVRTDRSIEWGHVLAWCARDQEARFQNSHDWRSPRSDSEWPSFRAAKADALFVMRALLGLFLPDELKGEEDLAASLKRQEELENNVVELKREPQFRINLYDGLLRSKLRTILPDQQGIDDAPLRWDQLSLDLTRLTEMAAERLRLEIRKAEEDIAKAQDEIDALGGEMRELKVEQEMLAATFGMEGAAVTEIGSAISQRQHMRSAFQQYKDEMCQMGGVLYGECDYVRRRRDGLTITQLQDAHAMEQAEAQRADIQRRLSEQRSQMEHRSQELKAAHEALRSRRDATGKSVKKQRYALDELTTALSDLVTWTEKSTKVGEFKELDDTAKSLQDEVAKADGLKKDLTALLSQHDSSRDLIASIFSGSVKSVLQSGTYDGKVGFQDRELSFQIVHGTTMSGEAVETLSVLLADVACLVYNSVSDRVRLPGFLLHDSPREADLSRRIYRTFIRFMASMQQHFGVADACPFQYIITTTTPPPEELRNAPELKLHLNAGVVDGLLYRRSLASHEIELNEQMVTEPESLFQDSENENGGSL